MSEHTWVAIDGISAEASFHGIGPVYILRPDPSKKNRDLILSHSAPLSFKHTRVLRWNSSSPLSEHDRFSFGTWKVISGFDNTKADPNRVYNVSVTEGELSATSKGGSVYG